MNSLLRITKMLPFFSNGAFTLYQGDCVEVLKSVPPVDMVFADPPYFLSNDGLSIQSGEIVSVNKGDWDKLNGCSIHDFNYKWISAVRNALKPSGTIWVSGTMHNIFSVYEVLNSYLGLTMPYIMVSARRRGVTNRRSPVR